MNKEQETGNNEQGGGEEKNEQETGNNEQGNGRAAFTEAALAPILMMMHRPIGKLILILSRVSAILNLSHLSQVVFV